MLIIGDGHQPLIGVYIPCWERSDHISFSQGITLFPRWDMLVLGWPFPPKSATTFDSWPERTTKSPVCFFFYLPIHLLFRHPILRLWEITGGSAWGPVKYMWMALESNQPGHPGEIYGKRGGGDPSFKERPEKHLQWKWIWNTGWMGSKE